MRRGGLHVVQYNEPIKDMSLFKVGHGKHGFYFQSFTFT